MNGGRDTARRTWNSLRYGSVGIVDDTGPAQMMQVQASYLETFPARPVVQHFGFASNAPANADVVLLSPNGDPSTSVVIGTNHQTYRPTGQASGETTVYNAFGITISLGHAGITINGGGFPIVITNSPTVTQNGDLHVTGEVIRGFGGADQVALGTHKHGTGSAATGTIAPTPGT